MTNHLRDIAADALFEADKYHDGYINSSEIFIDFEEIRFFDSNGNIFLYTKESGKIEIVVDENLKPIYLPGLL